MNIITRELINKNFYHVTDDMDYTTLCKRINKFKNLFISNGVEKWDTLTIATLTVPADLIACYFAAWELGLRCYIANDKILEGKDDIYINTLKHTIYGISKTWTGYRNHVIHDFNKPIDPNNSGGLTRMDLKDGLFRKFLECYHGNEANIVMTMDDVAPMPGTPIQPWEVYPDDECIEDISNIMKVKKHTDYWLPRPTTHAEMLSKVKKHLPDFTQDKVALSRNPHHNNCLEYYFLPALMTATKIYDVNIMDYSEREEEQMILNFMTDFSNKTIYENEIERVLVPDKVMYDYMQNKKDKPFKNEVVFNIGREIVKSN